jgi:hypothetical protein
VQEPLGERLTIGIRLGFGLALRQRQCKYVPKRVRVAFGFRERKLLPERERLTIRVDEREPVTLDCLGACRASRSLALPHAPDGEPARGATRGLALQDEARGSHAAESA